jgi:putative ABC transport system permease protein
MRRSRAPSRRSSFFTFFIGVLVVGGFFQIRRCKKWRRSACSKQSAPATGPWAWTAVLQIVTVNAIGVAIGTAGSLALGATFPSNAPILFTGEAVVTAIVALLTIGPAGGLVSVFRPVARRAAARAWHGAVSNPDQR